MSEWVEFAEPLRRFFGRNVRDDAERDDLVQETLSRLAQASTAAPSRPDNPRAFVFAVARNLLRDRARRRRTRAADAHVDIAEVTIRDAAASPEVETMHRQELEIAARALSELREPCRRALLLHRLDGLTYGEIAAELGVSASMVQKYIAQALAHLRRRLAEEGEPRT
ncbi:MAG: RNA polymerase sigma factor [Caulobacterales bacterium]|nr:RNA polymerase sigma factor [Caulobacterales bacterium]